MGLYHLGLYIQRKKDKWNLWFAIANLIAGLRIAASGEYIISLLGEVPWWVIIRIELGSFFFGMAIILIYLRSLFTVEMKRIPFLLGVTVSGAFGLASIVIPTVMSSLLVFPFQLISFVILIFCIVVVVLAVKHKRLGSKVFATGFLVLGVFIANDILLNMNQIYSISMTGIGFILFLLSQSYLLSARYTSTLSSNEKLTEELDGINRGLEKQVEQRTEELEKSLEELNQNQLIIQEKNNALEMANNTRTKLFGIIGHDLRGSLGSLQMALQNVEEDIEDGDLDEDELKTTVHALSKSAGKTFTLLNNLFEWDKSQIGELHYNPEPFRLQEIVMNNLSLLKELMEEKSIVSSTNIDPEVMVYADKNIMDTVLRNLLSNAIKFTPPSGKTSIYTAVSETDSEAQVSVTDTGVGISQDRINDIFEYDRKKSTVGTNNETSTGLGLALCREFVEKNHRRITVNSKENDGSTFIFSIPLRKPEL